MDCHQGAETPCGLCDECYDNGTFERMRKEADTFSDGTDSEDSGWVEKATPKKGKGA